MNSFGPCARTRENILSKTRWLLRHRPTDRLRMEDVARTAGVSRRTIYNQFDGYEALLHACFEQLVAELSRNVQIDIPSTADPETGLSLLGIHAAHLFSDERYADVVRHIVRLGNEHDWLDEVCRRQIKAPIIIAVENQLLRHRRAFGGLDTRDLATHYVTMIEALSVWPILLDAPRPEAQNLDDTEIRGVTHIFVTTYRRRRTERPASLDVRAPSIQ